MRQALEINRQSYGPDHPTVSIRLNNLAQLLKATNRLGEAEPLMRQALAMDEQSYGPHHPKVAIALNNLANLLEATNRREAAEPYCRRGVEIFLGFTHNTGHEHPHLRGGLRNYSQILQAMGMSAPEIRARFAELGVRIGE